MMSLCYHSLCIHRYCDKCKNSLVILFKLPNLNLLNLIETTEDMIIIVH